MTGYRTGFGYDIHGLETPSAGKLVLGGIQVAEGITAVAHSDGDALIHSLIDALLGAIGEGDIGEHFPDTDTRYKKISSRILLEEIAGVLEQKNATVVNIDITIILQEIKLISFKEQIRQNIAHILGLNSSQVNVKAKTKEHFDAAGRGEAVEVYSAVLVEIRG